MISLLDLITPTNLDSEREKFFASPSYNPIFHYIWQDRPTTPSFSVETKHILWDAIKIQDHNSITEAASILFEVKIDDNVLVDANQLLEVKGKVSSGSAMEYVRLMQEALSYFEIADLKVIVAEESGFNTRPNHKDKTLIISKHIHFEYFSMEGEVHHELVHILRFRNGQFNGIKRSPNYLPTEEGLASWCQDNANDDNGAAQHAMEYIASDVGLRGSLRDIYDSMCHLGMSKELAWKRACRHKFGFVDTSKPGDILKPAMYFANEEKVSTLTTDEKLRLFVGKIAISELPDHPTYAGLWSEEKLIGYFKL